MITLIIIYFTINIVSIGLILFATNAFNKAVNPKSKFNFKEDILWLFQISITYWLLFFGVFILIGIGIKEVYYLLRVYK